MLSRSCRPGWSTPGSASDPGLTLTPFLAFAAPPPRPSTAQAADTGTRVDRSCREADAGSMLGSDSRARRFAGADSAAPPSDHHHVAPVSARGADQLEGVDGGCGMARYWREPWVDACREAAAPVG